MAYIWLDDIRPCPPIDTRTSGYWAYAVACSVNDAKDAVLDFLDDNSGICFDLDHDLGDFSADGGDAIKLVDWLVENYHDKHVNFKFHFHSANPVGVANMKAAVEKYWEVF